MKEREVPVIQIDDTHLFENYYERDGKTWDCPTLIEYCKMKQYEVFDLPLIGIALNGLPWGINDMSDFIHHTYRVNRTDLKYPIILDNHGNIADGWHRVVNAILNGESTIKAIRIQVMPSTSGNVQDIATNSK